MGWELCLRTAAVYVETDVCVHLQVKVSLKDSQPEGLCLAQGRPLLSCSAFRLQVLVLTSSGSKEEKQ